MKKKTFKVTALFLSFLALFSFSQSSLEKRPVNVSAAPASGAVHYTDPSKYYEGIEDSLTGSALISALSTLTSTGFVSNSYSSLPSIYRYSDVSLTDPSKMRLFYTGTTRSFTPGSMPGSTNKEHVWPASWYGTGDREEGAGSPGADAHNIYPMASELNSKRGSSAFDELDFSKSFKAYEITRTDWSYGTPGDNDSYVWSTSFNYSNGGPTDILYPKRGERGIVARTLMYVATRYYNNPKYPVKLHDKATTLNSGRIGKLSTLLKWHFEEPATEWEIKRNNEVASRWHHNRNPFVDNPDYARRIFYYLPEPDQSAPTEAVKAAIETYGAQEEKILLDKTNLTLEVGETLQVNITANPLSETVVWESSDSTILSVNNGLITALKEGNATVTARGNETSATVTVRVVPLGGAKVLIESLKFNDTNLTMRVGQSKTLGLTISPSDASNKVLSFTSSNSNVAAINDSGDVVAFNVGTTTLRAETTDGSALSATLNLTVNAKSSSNLTGWHLLKSGDTLAVGDELVIAAKEYNVTAGKQSSDYLSEIQNSTFSADKSEITSLHANTLIFTLGGVSDAWTLTNNGKTLRDNGEKKLSFDTGTATWKITIDLDNNAKIQSTTNNSYSIEYNNSADRFTTYKPTSNQYPIQLYRYAAEINDEVKDAAEAYISEFMARTGVECAANNVLTTTWQQLKQAYSLLEPEVKDYIYNNAEVDILVASFVARYRVIIDNYEYENFLVNSQNMPVLGDSNMTPASKEGQVILSVVFFIVSFALIGYIFVVVKKKSRNQ